MNHHKLLYKISLTHFCSKSTLNYSKYDLQSYNTKKDNFQWLYPPKPSIVNKLYLFINFFKLNKSHTNCNVL